MTVARDLTLNHTLKCSADAAYRCWTSAELLRRFFAPAPGRVLEAVIDPIPGGRFYTRMMFEDFGEIAGEGCVLHVVPGRRLVWTDTLSFGWRPNPSGFFTADLSFSPTDKGHCDYRVICRHADAEAAEKHRQMGFEQGWSMVADQLGKLAASL